jgi:hypothetical protein
LGEFKNQGCDSCHAGFRLEEKLNAESQLIAVRCAKLTSFVDDNDNPDNNPYTVAYSGTKATCTCKENHYSQERWLDDDNVTVACGVDDTTADTRKTEWDTCLPLKCRACAHGSLHNDKGTADNPWINSTATVCKNPYDTVCTECDTTDYTLNTATGLCDQAVGVCPYGTREPAPFSVIQNDTACPTGPGPTAKFTAEYVDNAFKWTATAAASTVSDNGQTVTIAAPADSTPLKVCFEWTTGTHQVQITKIDGDAVNLASYPVIPASASSSDNVLITLTNALTTSTVEVKCPLHANMTANIKFS